VDIEIRAIGPDEVDALVEADQRGFGGVPEKSDASRSWTEGELDRTRIAFEGDEMVGVSRNYSFELTVPGGAFVSAAAVSWVAVLPTHRRRGLLRQLIRALHDDAREREEPVSMLTASESAIYGRFGFGCATWRVGVKAERARVQFRDPGDRGRMRMVTRDDAMKRLPALYDAMRPLRAGYVTRPSYWWPQVFWDFVVPKDKATFAAIHSDATGTDDGFVTYDLEQSWSGGLPTKTLNVTDFQAANPAAHKALWEYVFGVDLVHTVTNGNVPIDDPLRHLVTDTRRIEVDYVNDGLWVAPLEPAPYLAARTYTTADALVIEVHEPWGGSRRFALDGSPDGAQCAETTKPADLSCTTATLGACSLGGTRWTELAQAGLVEGDTRTLERADAMFLSTPAPALLSGF
jgi:predicted acetyltransferase